MRSVENHGAGDARTAIRSIMAVGVICGGTFGKGGKDSADGAIVLGLETDVGAFFLSGE